MNVRETANALKLSLLVAQLAVVVILIFTGIQFKDVKATRDLLEPLRNQPDAWLIFHELDALYYCLLVAIILLSIKTPMMLASLFLNNYVVMYVASFLESIAGGLYAFHLGYFNSRIWLGGAIAGVIITVVSSTIASILAKRIKKGQM